MADAHGSGPCGSNTMRVQVSFPALYHDYTNPVPIGDAWGFVVFLNDD